MALNEHYSSFIHRTEGDNRLALVEASAAAWRRVKELWDEALIKAQLSGSCSYYASFRPTDSTATLSTSSSNAASNATALTESVASRLARLRIPQQGTATNSTVGVRGASHHSSNSATSVDPTSQLAGSSTVPKDRSSLQEDPHPSTTVTSTTSAPGGWCGTPNSVERAAAAMSSVDVGAKRRNKVEAMRMMVHGTPEQQQGRRIFSAEQAVRSSTSSVIPSAMASSSSQNGPGLTPKCPEGASPPTGRKNMSPASAPPATVAGRKLAPL